MQQQFTLNFKIGVPTCHDYIYPKEIVLSAFKMAMERDIGLPIIIYNNDPFHNLGLSGIEADQIVGKISGYDINEDGTISVIAECTEQFKPLTDDKEVTTLGLVNTKPLTDDIRIVTAFRLNNIAICDKAKD